MPAHFRHRLSVCAGAAGAIALASGAAFSDPPLPPVNDPAFDLQHYLFTWDPDDDYEFFLSRAGMAVIDAWSILKETPPDGFGQLTQGEGVQIGVIDGPLDDAHQDLQVHAATWTLLSPRAPSPTAESQIHATAVVGILAADGHNETDIAGVSFGSDLVIAEQRPLPDTITQHAHIIARLDDIDEEECVVVSNSWDFDGNSETLTAVDAVHERIAQLAAVDLTISSVLVSGREGLGLPFVFASGNDSLPVGRGGTPAATFAEVIAVSNMGVDGKRQETSNYGPWIDVAAPGGMIISLKPDGVDTCPVGFDYCCFEPALKYSEPCDVRGDLLPTLQNFTGTSASAPNAAGVIALAASGDPTLEGPQLRRMLTHTARKPNLTELLQYAPLTGFSDAYGYGLVDANAMVEATLNDETWPAHPTAPLAVQDTSTEVDVSWANAEAPGGGYARGEYAGVLVVRFPGNVWDLHSHDRTATGDAIDEIIWSPHEGDPYDVGDPAASGGEVMAFDDIDDVEDDEVTRDDAATYAIYTYNAADFYSVPAVVLKRSHKRWLVQEEDETTSETGVSTIQPSEDIGEDGVINELTGLAVDSDALDHCGISDTYCRRIQPTEPGEAWLQKEFDLTRFDSAAVTLNELVEVGGFFVDSDNYLRKHFCSLIVTDLDAEPDPVEETVLAEHTSITLDRQTGHYIWRPQEFDLDRYCGKRISIRWQVEIFNSDETFSPLLGWLLDNIQVRGEPMCPADLDLSGSVGSPDLSILYSEWGAVACGDEKRGNIDRDSDVDSTDSGLLLGSWGSGCYGESFMGGGGGGGATPWSYFEFETWEDYVEWMNSLNEEELAAHIAEVIALIQEYAF